MRSVAIIQVGNFDPDRHDRGHPFVGALERAFLDCGFAVLVEHGVPQRLLQDVYGVMQELFRYPDAHLKARYWHPAVAAQRGYAPYLLENAAGASMPDLKRFWMCATDESTCPNLWPARESPRFQPVMQELMAHLLPLAMRILAAVELFTGLHGAFRDAASGVGHYLRPLHYPAGVPVGEWRSAPHTDLGILTLLVAAITRAVDESIGGTISRQFTGLQVTDRSGQLVRVEEEPGSIVVNVCDQMVALARYHGYAQLISTVHGVTVTEEAAEADRYSIPLFVQMRDDVAITDDDGTPTTGGQYLARRLSAISNGVLAPLEERVRVVRALQGLADQGLTFH